MKATLDSKLTDAKIFPSEIIPAFDEDDVMTLEGEKFEARLETIGLRERCFRLIFYALSGLTAVLVMQVIWQIATLTARSL
jgi:hypothetical protein